MNGQTRARLAATAGLIALLLTGMSAWIVTTTFQPGVEQAIGIADTPNLATVKPSRDSLGEAFHNDARQARLHTQELVVADLERSIAPRRAVLVAKAVHSKPERG